MTCANLEGLNSSILRDLIALHHRQGPQNWDRTGVWARFGAIWMCSEPGSLDTGSVRETRSGRYSATKARMNHFLFFGFKCHSKRRGGDPWQGGEGPEAAFTSVKQAQTTRLTPPLGPSHGSSFLSQSTRSTLFDRAEQGANLHPHRG